MKQKEKKAKSMVLSKDKSKGISVGVKSSEKSLKMSMMGVSPNASDHEYASSKLMQEYQRVASTINDEAYDMKINSKKRNISPEKMSLLVKEFVRLSGIDVVGIAKIDFGLKEFCELCRRCENNCPVKAISSEASISEAGEKYWEHDKVYCMEM